MPVTRTYRCDVPECGAEFEYFHMRRDEPYPDCPVCAGLVANVPGRFAIKTNRSRAIDLAHQVAEQNFGMTDMRDNQREGDIAAPGVAPMHTAEAEELTRAMREAQQAANAPVAEPMMNLKSFWQTASGQSLEGVDPATYSAPGAKEAREAGLDPVSLVEKVKQGGHHRMKFDVMARGNGE